MSGKGRATKECFKWRPVFGNGVVWAMPSPSNVSILFLSFCKSLQGGLPRVYAFMPLHRQAAKFYDVALPISKPMN